MSSCPPHSAFTIEWKARSRSLEYALKAQPCNMAGGHCLHVNAFKSKILMKLMGQSLKRRPV